MGGYFGGGGEGLGGGGEGGGGEGEGGGGLGEVCCAAQLHPKRQMIANRNVNIWDTTDRSLGSKEIPVGGPDAFLWSATACPRSSHKFVRYKKILQVRVRIRSTSFYLAIDLNLDTS
jgi:hypothetical protein